MSEVTPRKGMPSPRLSESEFRRRFLDQFADPAYGPLAAELDKIAGAAWPVVLDQAPLAIRSHCFSHSSNFEPQ